MNGKLILALFVVAFAVNSCESAIRGDLLSTLRITAKLCLCKRNDETAAGFFACYDQAPGKAQFVKCQVQTFGTQLDTKAAVTTACLNAAKLPAYASCLKTEFAAAGLDQEDAVTKVNICQAGVVGISK